MEKHRCKLCYRRFSNGRALGGHMKSHMMHLPVHVHPKPAMSSLSNSSDSTEPEEGEIVTLQDKGSDTESTKNVTRRRSKRTRKPAHLVLRNYQDSDCNNKLGGGGGDGVSYYCDDVEQQPGSSISEVTSEEDVAFCLMMMSRDKWVHNGPETEYEHGYGYGYGYEKEFSNIGGGDDDDDEIVPMSSHKKRYKCETCNKVFRSYQALGGHRASHKKTRGIIIVDKNDHKTDNDNRGKNHMVVVAKEEEKKIHECPICFRVFASGQALGGHKRSHVIAGNNGVNVNNNDIQSQTIAQSSNKKKVIAENLIDLNLPAPIDDEFDEEFVSQIATSAISNVHL